jgi:hypothetical protein
MISETDTRTSFGHGAGWRAGRHRDALPPVSGTLDFNLMFFKEWQDFVTYPLDPERVRTSAARLDTSVAFHRGPDGRYPKDYKPSKGAVIDRDVVVKGDDVFEGMCVDNLGHMQIWTRQYIWLLVRDGKSGGIEKLRRWSRHPPIDHLQVVPSGQHPPILPDG